jgi:hypothetical protein
MFGILFYLLLVSDPYCYAMIYNNIQDLVEYDFEQLGERGKCH